MAEVMFVTVVGSVVTAAPGAGFRVELGKATVYDCSDWLERATCTMHVI